MQNSSCSTLFICTAIFCWDYHYLKYSFFNITKCKPKTIYFKSNLQLIPLNNNYVKIQDKHIHNGFICSNCIRENFLKQNNLSILNQCYKQITRIKLQNYCPYRQTQSFCQCFPSEKFIEPITDWIQTLIKPGKSLINTNRVININKSSSLSIYIFVSFILFLIIIGGIIGIIFYWIKLKSCQLRTLK